MVVLLKDAELEKMYTKPLGQTMTHNLPRISVWLLLWNEGLRPWGKGSQTGHQSMDLFQSIQSQSVSRLKKPSNFGYCYYCTYKGEKVHLSKILPDCSRKKTFSLCGHDWEHMWTTPHLAQPLPVPGPSLSLSLLLSHSLFLIRKKPSRIWRFLPSLGRGTCSGLITSSSVGFPTEQSVIGLGVQWLREAWQI